MGLFLLIRAIPSLAADNVNFITSSEFVTTDANNLRFGIADLFRVTVLSSMFALVIAVPIAIGIATFLTNYAPRRFARPLSYPGRPAGRGALDRLRPVGHLRAGPGARAGATLAQREPELVLPVRDGNVSLAGGGTIFTAGMVLAVMILPIITVGLRAKCSA